MFFVEKILSNIKIWPYFFTMRKIQKMGLCGQHTSKPGGGPSEHFGSVLVFQSLSIRWTKFYEMICVSNLDNIGQKQYCHRDGHFGLKCQLMKVTRLRKVELQKLQMSICYDVPFHIMYEAEGAWKKFVIDIVASAHAHMIHLAAWM